MDDIQAPKHSKFLAYLPFSSVENPWNFYMGYWTWRGPLTNDDTMGADFFLPNLQATASISYITTYK